MDIYNSSDSEFDLEADEAECRLYTQLYFGEGSCEEKLTNKNQEISRALHNSPKYVDGGFKPSNRTIHNSKSHQYIHKDFSLSENSISQTCNVTENCSTVNSSPPVQFDSASNNGLLNKNVDQGKGSKTGSRIRNISICSTESISGKEPLDNLYCNYGNFEVSLVNDCIRNSLDPIVEVNSSNKFEDSVGCSSEEESRYCIKPSKPKYPNGKNNRTSKKKYRSGSSTDEEICILPPESPKFVETLTLESDNSGSEESIQILLNSSPIKKNNKRKNTAKTKVIKKKLNKITSPIHILSEDSDESECEFLEATSSPMTSLTINVRKDKLNRNTTFSQSSESTKRNVGPISFVKSQVIFSKSRPITTRKPSCSKWTIEMSSLYDSDISEDFDVECIHASQSDAAEKWKIISEDYNVRPRNRYFNKQVRCYRCKEFGHQISKCPKIPHCLYCGSANHTQIGCCPDNCCLKCGEEVHGYCHMTNKVMICVLCEQAGHHAKLCPDIWRRFHSTTKGSIPVKPKKEKKRVEKRTAYCYNCGKKGHYGHECCSNNFKKYSLVASVAISYKPMDIDVLENLSFYRTRGPNKQMPMLSNDDEEENSSAVSSQYLQQKNCMEDCVEANNNQRIFRLKSSKTADIMYRMKYVKKEIKARSGASVLYTLRPSKKNWKVIISGNYKSVLEAEKIMNILLGKIPPNEYSDLYSKVKDWNNLPQEITCKMSENSLHNYNGAFTPRDRFTPSRKSTPIYDLAAKIKNSDFNQSIIYNGENSETTPRNSKYTPRSSKPKKLSKESMAAVTCDNSLLKFAKIRTSSKGKKPLNNSFLQSKKNSVITPGRKRIFPVDVSIDKVFDENTLLDSTVPDARNKINELKKSRVSLPLSKSDSSPSDINPINVIASNKKNTKKSSSKKGSIGGKILVKTIIDARDIIKSKKESKEKVSSVKNLNNNSKFIPSLSKFFVATSNAIETSKRKIKKTAKIKVNCRMSLGKEKYVVNGNKNSVNEIR